MRLISAGVTFSKVPPVISHPGNIYRVFIGGSKRALGTRLWPLSVQLLLFSCSFRQKSFQIIVFFCSKLRGWRPPLGNPGSVTGFLQALSTGFHKNTVKNTKIPVKSRNPVTWPGRLIAGEVTPNMLHRIRKFSSRNFLAWEFPAYLWSIFLGTASKYKTMIKERGMSPAPHPKIWPQLYITNK